MDIKKILSASLTVCAVLFLLLSLTSTTSANLIGHWAPDETTGTIAVDSVAGNNGVLQGGMTFDADPDCCDGNDATDEWNFTAHLDGNPFPVKNINEEMSGAITTNESIYFGRRVGTGWVGGAHNSDGAIDDVGIFDVALTPSQIQDIMSTGVASLFHQQKI